MFAFKIVLTMAVFALFVDVLIRARQEKNRYFTILLAMGFLYGLGKYLQFWHLGPAILRWYVSDIGFVPMLAAFPLLFAFNKRRLFSAVRFANYSFAAAVAFEFVELYANAFIPEGTFGARGDWWDIVIFFLTFLFVRFFLLKKLTEELARRDQQIKILKKRIKKEVKK